MARLFLEDQVRAHASAGEFFYSSIVLGAVSVSVKVPRPFVFHILEKLHEPERRFKAYRAKSQVLIIPARHLIIEVDMEEFACLPSLRDSMQKVEPCHLLVCKLGIDTHHVGVI